MAIRYWLGFGLVSLLAGQRCPVDRAFLRLGVLSESRKAAWELEADTLWVPVVFHVLAGDSGRWLPAWRLRDQLLALNRDFRQAKIQFYLPRYGPNGVETCGITWHLTPLAVMHDWYQGEDSLKHLVRWPLDSFLNIWVVDGIQGRVIGYARPLEDSLAGIVLDQAVVGDRVGVLSPFDWGRTAVHEMGHVFSLLHPFEGGCAGLTPQTCSTGGDEICDTPGQSAPVYGCPASQNSCSDQPVDLPDPLDNLMGYVDDSCMRVFTPLQIARMRAYLVTVGATLVSLDNDLARGRALEAVSCQQAISYLDVVSKPAFRVWQVGDYVWSEPRGHLRLYDARGLCLLEGPSPLCVAHLAPGFYVVQHRQGFWVRLYLWP